MGCNCNDKGKSSLLPVGMTASDCGVPQAPARTCGNCGSPCKEDHTVTIVESTYTTTVCTCGSWVMPAVGESVQLYLNKVADLLPEAILYNASVGHLHVISYDRASGYVLAINRGGDDNAEGGTTFPEGMCFHVGIPIECSCTSDWVGPCLTADFTSPAIGDTAQVSVNSVSGLFVNDTVSIGGYMYKITHITDATSFTVKNEGYGALVGTVIKSDPSCSGRPCQVKVVVISNDNPCEEDAVHSGRVVGCSDGTIKPIDGTATGQVLGWNNDSKRWELVNAGLSDVCTFTTKCSVTLDPQVTTYLIYVDNPTIFEVGNTFTLDNIIYTVTEVHTGSTENNKYIRASRVAPSAIGSIPQGTTICSDSSISCDLENWCQQIATNRDNINTILGPVWRPRALTQLSTCGAIHHAIIASSSGMVALVEDSPTYTPTGIPTLNLQVPTNLPSNSKVNVIGHCNVYYQGRIFTDAHYDHVQSTGGLLHMIRPNQMKLSLFGNIAVNGSIISGAIPDMDARQDFVFTPSVPKPGFDPSGVGNTAGAGSQNICTPFAVNNISASGGSVVSISFGTSVSCLNARRVSNNGYDPGNGDNIPVNDPIKTNVNRYVISFNAMLVIQ